MEDFYARLLAYQSENRKTNKELGAIIEMDAEAFRVAVKRKNLSKYRVEELQKMLDDSNIKKAPDENRSLTDNEDDRAVDYIIRHAERLRKTNPNFNMFCELIEVKAERAFMAANQPKGN